MALLTVLAVVVPLVGLAVGFIAAITLDRDDVADTWGSLSDRLSELMPYALTAGAVLLLKQLGGTASLRLSEAIGLDVTPWLYGLEGEFVAHLQALVPAAMVPLVSAVYVIGFAVLLVAPLVVYFFAALDRLKALIVAYAVNYGVGFVCYTLLIAYGPRTYLDGQVVGLMFERFPAVRHLTGAVSVSSNVFPSLHTSLSVTVLLFAWRTRRRFPALFLIVAPLSLGVVLSTMVLGIHWASDVVAGLLLALGAVALANRMVGERGVRP